MSPVHTTLYYCTTDSVESSVGSSLTFAVPVKRERERERRMTDEVLRGSIFCSFHDNSCRAVIVQRLCFYPRDRRGPCWVLLDVPHRTNNEQLVNRHKRSRFSGTSNINVFILAADEGSCLISLQLGMCCAIYQSGSYRVLITSLLLVLLHCY